MARIHAEVEQLQARELESLGGVLGLMAARIDDLREHAKADPITLGIVRACARDLPEHTGRLDGYQRVLELLDFIEGQS